MTYEIIVQLKAEVLDPEGRAIQETLGRLGFAALKAVTVAKRYTLELADAGAPDSATLVEQIAREYLANPVSETFQVRKL
jgi:phosphoribosylformylglycinamidine synthase PurS subunit